MLPFIYGFGMQKPGYVVQQQPQTRRAFRSNSSIGPIQTHGNPASSKPIGGLGDNVMGLAALT